MWRDLPALVRRICTSYPYNGSHLTFPCSAYSLTLTSPSAAAAGLARLAAGATLSAPIYQRTVHNVIKHNQTQPGHGGGPHWTNPERYSHFNEGRQTCQQDPECANQRAKYTWQMCHSYDQIKADHLVWTGFTQECQILSYYFATTQRRFSSKASRVSSRIICSGH